MTGIFGAAASLLGGVLGTAMGGSKKSSVSDLSRSGFDITNLMGNTSPITDDGVNTSDSVSAGTQDALSMLKDMTDGGISGYFKYVVKQAREKVMDSMGLTEDKLAAMTPAARAAAEKKIDEAVGKMVAKMMGVDPDQVNKALAKAGGSSGIVTASDDTGPNAATKVAAGKAYKGVSSAADELAQLLQG